MKNSLVSFFPDTLYVRRTALRGVKTECSFGDGVIGVTH